MKLRFLQFTVFIVGCLGLFFICYPDCLAIFNQNECEKLHFRITEGPEATNSPMQVDSTQNLSLIDTVLSTL